MVQDLPNGIVFETQEFSVRKYDLSSIAADISSWPIPMMPERFELQEFEINQFIGHGAFSLVYEASHKRTQRPVAIKLLRPPTDFQSKNYDESCYSFVLETFRQELRIVVRAGSHPNIVGLLGAVASNGCGSDLGCLTALVMEPAVMDLASLVRAGGSVGVKGPGLPLKVARRWMGDILAGLAHLHRLGVVHMDLTSSNVLLFGDLRAKLSDFGLSRTLAAGGDSEVDRELVTLWNRAPELLMGVARHTALVDVWAAGCVALELLLGRPPFQGDVGAQCGCNDQRHLNYNADQLMKVLAMVGTPTDENWLQSMPCYSHFHHWPHYPPRLSRTIQRACTPSRLVGAVGSAPSSPAGSTASSADASPTRSPPRLAAPPPCGHVTGACSCGCGCGAARRPAAMRRFHGATRRSPSPRAREAARAIVSAAAQSPSPHLTVAAVRPTLRPSSSYLPSGVDDPPISPNEEVGACSEEGGSEVEELQQDVSDFAAAAAAAAAAADIAAAEAAAEWERLIGAMLTVDPRQRISAAVALALLRPSPHSPD